MNLKEKIEKSIQLRNIIFETEKELLLLDAEIKAGMLEELEFEEDIKVGDYVSEEKTNKKYKIDKINMYYDKYTLLPYLSPILISLKADMSNGRIIGTNNYIFNSAIGNWFEKDNQNETLLSQFGQVIHNTSAINIASANKISDYFKVKINHKEVDFIKKAGYTSQSGYSSTLILEDDIFDVIISHKTAPSNFKHLEEKRHDYFLEILTKDNRVFIYTTKENQDKAVRITQKKLKELKEMIINSAEEILELTQYNFTSSEYHSSFHCVSTNDDSYTDIDKYMNKVYA